MTPKGLDSAEARERMVEDQIACRGIHDPQVIEAFRRVPREMFVPEAVRSSAYEDHPLSIGCGQTISQPYMVALMTQELRLEPGQRVLEIGTGSGYQTAILDELGAEVFTVERIAELSDRARQVLTHAGYTRIRYHVGDGTLGWHEEAPFDRILVTAGAPHVPQPLVDQLAEGGRLVVPVGGYGYQDLTVVTRQAGQVCQQGVCGCVFVKLIGREGWPEAELD
jgi:protein-L-isoaspartate(D-aspartate) O-methyltransferase